MRTKIPSCLTGLLLASPLSGAFAALVTPDLAVTGPGKVLMVDGTDANVTVKVTVVDGTVPLGQYDFGFVTGGGYTKITSTSGSHTFLGGDRVDFALRDRGPDKKFGTGDDVIYSISNPVDYADQWYFLPIDPAYSRHPVVSSPYYHELVLAWDLNRDGILDTGFDIAASTPLSSKDGVAPVPLPAAAWLFGSGLLGLTGVGRRKTTLRRSR